MIWDHKYVFGFSPKNTPFVVDSLLCSERFFSEYSSFPLSSKTNIPNSNSTRNQSRRRTSLWMCYLQIIIDLFIDLFIISKFDRCPSKLVRMKRQSPKLPLHWDTLFREILKGSFDRGVPPWCEPSVKPWPRLKTKIVHFTTLFKKRDPILWP